MEKSCKDIRREGKLILKDNWKVFSLAIGIFVAFALLVSFVIGNVASSKVTYGYYLDSSAYVTAYVLFIVLELILIVVSSMMECGTSNVCLKLYGENDVRIADTFYGFSFFLKVIGLYLWQCLFILLWSMLFIIPGIIAALRYSQSFFIFVENPEKTIRECVNESKLLMKGNIFKIFKLNLSYIGWILLVALPFGIVSGISEYIYIYGSYNTYLLLSVVALIIEVIATSILMPYIYSGMVVFYKDLFCMAEEKSKTAQTEETIL